jgi:serine protease Do
MFVRLAVCCLVALAASNRLRAQSAVDLPDGPLIARAVSIVEPAVVQIETIGGMAQVGGQPVAALPRTGTVIDDQGHVVTAMFNLAHQPTTIFVRLPGGQRQPAEIVSQDFSRKITLLRVAGPPTSRPPKLADRSTLAVGQTVIAVGRSLSMEQTSVSVGILSAVSRIRGTAIQTDAAVSLHNYGGPLIDLDGKLTGILVPRSPQGDAVAEGTDWYDSGIGFAVPLDRRRLEEMVTGKDLHAGLAGITFREDEGYASPPVVAACPGNSPAARGGLKPGDRILLIDGTAVQLVTEVRELLGPRYAGDEVSVEYQRDDQRQTVTLQLVEAIQPWRHAMLGIISKPDNDGLVVQDLVPDGPAELAGVRPGDRLVSLLGSPLSDQAEMESRLMTLEPGATVELVLQRDEGQTTLPLVLKPLTADPLTEADPDGLNAVPPAGTGEATGMVQIRVAESPHPCHAWFPETSQPGGLLLWLEPPGPVDPESILKRWQPWCQATGTALLIPRSVDPEKWSRDEIPFLNQLARQAAGQFPVDPHRLTVGGRLTGAVMASLVAMSERATWRGLVLVNSGASMRTASFQSEPGYRQLILMLEADAAEPVTAGMQRWFEHFGDQGFPVFRAKSSSRQMEATVTGWITTVGRF